MHLLGWYQLEAIESSAAIRFPKAVRISSIRIFPTGTLPFSQLGVVALTEPEAFFLNVFFHINGTNKLAPTRIAYAGGQTDFTVDMGPEQSTKLVVFNGIFQSLFVTLYGDLVAERPEVGEYEAKTLLVPTYLQLSDYVDPANSTNPVSLAKQMFQLLLEPPSLSVATRLIFSLKPEKDDWDHPDFPNLYADLEVLEDSTLEELVQLADRPIRDDVSLASLTEFATAIRESLHTKSSDEAYYIAKLLSVTASQQIPFSRTILEHLDLCEVFNEHTLDEETVLWLRDAAANIEIARYLTDDKPFFSNLQEISTSSKTEKSVQKAMKKLLTRLHGWQCFEDALINPDGDFSTSAAFLKDITTTEHSTGCWLECMITHDNLIEKLSVAGTAERKCLPPLLFQSRSSNVLYEDFIAFVRALLGVSTVLVVLAWADSMGNVQCRERALSVLVLWQGTDGYREIVNHCLLLRQMTQRLSWNKSDDIPRGFGILAERLLVGLSKDPQAMLSDDLVNTILDLNPPFSFITQEESKEMKKIASVAHDGLYSAIEELVYTSVRPLSLRRLRILRASIAIVTEELSYENGEKRVLEGFWKDQKQGMIPTLITILADVSDDINHHFALKPLPRMNQSLSDLLFRTADDILCLISYSIPTYHMPSRELQPLVMAISNLYACSGAASVAFSRHSSAYAGAQIVRQTCPEILRAIVGPDNAELTVLNPQLVIRTLLDTSLSDGIRDPVSRLLQIYELFDKILPQESTPKTSSYWATEVFPKALPELKAFCDLLEPSTKLALFRRLIQVDKGELGLGEWLLTEQMKDLSIILQKISNLPPQDEYTTAVRYQLFLVLDFFELFVASTTKWAFTSFVSNEELSQVLDECLAYILDYDLDISSPALTRLLQQFAKHNKEFSPDTQFTILMLVLRKARADPSIPGALDYVSEMFKNLRPSSIFPERLRNELGRLLLAYSDQNSISTDNAETLLQILEWLVSQGDIKLTTLTGLSIESFNYLCSSLLSALPSTRQDNLSFVKGRLTIDEDQLLPLSTIELSDKLSLSLHSLDHLLAPQSFEPSTPKSGHKTPDILGVVISPPTALLRSPAATGLTKTYANNDFRQLRQSSSTRLNTSRLPSTHVDEFENLSQSPELLAAAAIIDASTTAQGNMVFPGFLSGNK